MPCLAGRPCALQHLLFFLFLLFPSPNQLADPQIRGIAGARKERSSCLLSSAMRPSAAAQLSASSLLSELCSSKTLSIPTFPWSTARWAATSPPPHPRRSRIHCLVGLWTAVLAQFIEINHGNHEPAGFKPPTQELLQLGLDSTQKPVKPDHEQGEFEQLNCYVCTDNTTKLS